MRFTKRRFKVGQKVYYYLNCGDYTGEIVTCVIKQATKDLSTGKITYRVSVDNESATFWRLTFLTERDLTDEYLYASKKQIEKEYKDEIAYNKLYKEMCSLENSLIELKSKLASEQEYKIPDGMTLSIGGTKQYFNKLYVEAKDVVIDGKVSLKEEIDKLKKRVKSLEKNIKQKTKKAVVSKKDDSESKDDATPGKLS